MKSIEFNEGQFDNLEKIAEELLAEPNDPRSYGYKRIFVRPKMNWTKISINCLTLLLLIGGIFVFLRYIGISTIMSLAVSIMVFLFCLSVNAKQIIICLVRIYQRYAPESIRNKCRFEPSCSQYMILSLQKYGLQKGLKKGIRRLKRCNINGGGFDFP